VVLRREGARAAPHIARRAAPLVSAIMPTADRVAFVPRAIQTFLRQDYAEKELVIVDDGVSPIAHLVPDDPRLRLIRFAPRLTVGAKRNIACEAARGDIMLHWDDDDWHAQDRLSRQVSAMEAAGAELCGSTTQLFLDRAAGQAWRYDYATLGDPRPWLAGGTLAYRASRWRRGPFEEVDVGEDARFVRAEPACIRSEVLGDVVVGMIHEKNVSPKRPRAPLWRQVALEDLAKLMGEDWVF
jgi:glycosyltransferase involved in cell wall biosynthesis